MVSRNEQERETGRRPPSPLQTFLSFVFIALLGYSGVVLCRFSQTDAVVYDFAVRVYATCTAGTVTRIILQAAVILLIVRILAAFTERFENGWLAWRLFRKNVQFLPLEHPVLRYPFVAVFYLNMPFIAGLEEFLFRHGLGIWPTVTMFDVVWRSLAFGLIHCLMGNSVRTGFIMSVLGVWLSYQYTHGGLELATASHLIFDVLLFTLVLLLWAFRGQHPLGNKN